MLYYAHHMWADKNQVEWMKTFIYAQWQFHKQYNSTCESEGNMTSNNKCLSF